MFFNMDPYFEISKRIAFRKSWYKIFISTIYKAAIYKQSFKFSESQFPYSEPRIVAASNSQTYSQGCKYALHTFALHRFQYNLWNLSCLNFNNENSRVISQFPKYILSFLRQSLLPIFAKILDVVISKFK